MGQPDHINLDVVDFHGDDTPGDVLISRNDPATVRVLKRAFAAEEELLRLKGGQPPRGFIWFHGDRQYQVGVRRVQVTEKEDNVLQAFLRRPAQDKRTLVSMSGEGDAVTI